MPQQPTQPYPSQIRTISKAADVGHAEAVTLARVIKAGHRDPDTMSYEELSVYARLARNVLNRRPDLRRFYERKR